MPTVILGKDAKTYYGTKGSTASTELTNIRDASLSMERGEADVTTRANQGWRATAPTLRSATFEFTMVWDPDDAGFAAIRDAYLSDGGTVALLVLDKEGGQGPDADWSITNFARDESLEEALTVNVTAKMETFREWSGAA
jgi:hypothetical protein